MNDQADALQLPVRRAMRYVVPLREGGSLPAVVEADDGELYVMKFRGAGQGTKGLVAELIAGRIGQVLGLPVPELVLLEMESPIGRSEPNPEIRDLLNASIGLNLGMRYLPGALAYNPMDASTPDRDLASAIVWFDAYVTNVDRTARNVNMLIAEDRLWLIDHGATLIFHHDWTDHLGRSQSPFPLIRQHVLLDRADRLAEADARLRLRLSDERLAAIVRPTPADWLADEPQFESATAYRRGYVDYLRARRDGADYFVEEAHRAREQL